MRLHLASIRHESLFNAPDLTLRREQAVTRAVTLRFSPAYFFTSRPMPVALRRMTSKRHPVPQRRRGFNRCFPTSRSIFCRNFDDKACDPERRTVERHDANFRARRSSPAHSVLTRRDCFSSRDANLRISFVHHAVVSGVTVPLIPAMGDPGGVGEIVGGVVGGRVPVRGGVRVSRGVAAAVTVG